MQIKTHDDQKYMFLSFFVADTDRFLICYVSDKFENSELGFVLDKIIRVRVRKIERTPSTYV